MPYPCEEHREVGRVWSWTLIVLFCLAILVWGLFNYRSIPDTPRRWDVGVLRDVPGESIYSTVAPRTGSEPAPQLAPLPEGTPLKGN